MRMQPRLQQQKTKLAKFQLSGMYVLVSKFPVALRLLTCRSFRSSTLQALWFVLLWLLTLGEFQLP